MKKLTTLFVLLTLTFTVSVFAINTLNLSVKGMHCGGCEMKFKSAATEINGINEVVSVSAANSDAVITYDEKVITADKVVEALASKTGYTIAANTGAGMTTAEGKPDGCCMKGQSNPACKSADKAKCAKTKCDKTSTP